MTPTTGGASGANRLVPPGFSWHDGTSSVSSWRRRDWPTAFEAVMGRLGPVRYGGEVHEHEALIERSRTNVNAWAFDARAAAR